jgi:hypothetical protein
MPTPSQLRIFLLALVVYTKKDEALWTAVLQEQKELKNKGLL